MAEVAEMQGVMGTTRKKDGEAVRYRLDNSGEKAPKRPPPGCLWKHPKTGGWYWRVKSSLVPAAGRGRGAYTNVPMVPNGRTTATTVKSIADACRQRLLREFTRGDGDPPDDGPAQKTPLTKWLDEFCDWNGHHASPQHVQVNRRQLRRFLDAAGAIRVADLREKAVLAFLSGLRDGGPEGKPPPAAERTVVKYRNTIHAFCKFLLRKGEIETNPAQFVEIRPPVKRPPRFLNDDQIAAFLAHAGEVAEPWLCQAACFALYAGLRLSELMKLKWTDVAKEAITTGGKSRDYRFVPIIPALRDIIASMRRGLKTTMTMTKNTVFPERGKRQWAEAFFRLTAGRAVFGELPGKRAGNQWHLLRSTYAVQQARGAWTGKPATVWQLMAWMGHTNPATTMRYVNIAHAAGMAGPAGSRDSPRRGPG